MAKEILDILMEMRSKGEPYAVATVVETVGSVSAKTGSKAVISHKGMVIGGWVGGGCAESTCCDAALESIKSGQTSIIEIINNRDIEGNVSEAISYNKLANTQSVALIKRISEIIELIESEIND